jgi:amidase
MSKQIAFYGDIMEEYTGTMIAQNNVDKRNYQKEYMGYWNSTEKETGTGRPVDAIIAPLAPYPAARPGMYGYYGTFEGWEFSR